MHDDRELLVAAFGTMREMVPSLREFDRRDQTAFEKFSLTVAVNPDLLVVYDRKRGRFARGTINCHVCTKADLHAGRCKWLDVPISQDSIFRHDVGGCAGVDLVPYLSHDGDPNETYERLIDGCLRGGVYLIKNGRIRTVVDPGGHTEESAVAAVLSGVKVPSVLVETERPDPNHVRYVDVGHDHKFRDIAWWWENGKLNLSDEPHTAVVDDGPGSEQRVLWKGRYDPYTNKVSIVAGHSNRMVGREPPSLVLKALRRKWSGADILWINLFGDNKWL